MDINFNTTTNVYKKHQRVHFHLSCEVPSVPQAQQKYEASSSGVHHHVLRSGWCQSVQNKRKAESK